jgi:endonuclease III
MAQPVQTTDKKVNEVTPKLFQRAPCAKSMAACSPQEIEELIRAIGLAPTKSRNLVKMSQLLVTNHEGTVPCTFEELEALPGVGHKTASVVMAQCHGCDSTAWKDCVCAWRCLCVSHARAGTRLDVSLHHTPPFA